MSGYAIQQRTLRDLRAAIKPSQPEPKIFLPDRFRKSTTELPDGTIIEIEDNYGGSGNRQKRLRGKQSRGQNGVVVEIKPTLPDKKESQKMDKNSEARQAKDRTEKTTTTDNKNDSKKQQGTNGQDRNDKKKSPPGSYVQHPENPEKVVSRAERRRLIKEELQKTAQGEERGYYQRRLW